MNIVDQDYWDKSYRGYSYSVANDEVTEFLDLYIEQINKQFVIKDCFEIGCYPGRYLAHISQKFGLCANGVDATGELDGRLTEWMRTKNVQVGTLYKDDAFKRIKRLTEEGVKFDLVYSVGFIEHFSDYLDVINLHGELLGRNGVLIITTPNFRGLIQRIGHILVDNDNYKRHVIEAMNPYEWRRLMEEKGFETVFCGYFGLFDFWVDKQKRNIFQLLLIRIFMRIKMIIKHRVRNDNPLYSPYCGMVLIKK